MATSPTTNNKVVVSLHQSLVLYSFIITTCIKLLLIPSYKSTDFDVHRNWLAITKHLPIAEWYYNDVNQTTVHTLDYPPTFAYFEYVLSNNFITNYLLAQGYIDDNCLALLGDDEIYHGNPEIITPQCVFFHRCTVIVSDVVLWLGAYIAVSGIVPMTSSSNQQSVWTFFKIFVLIVGNPGLLWLDHVHFQYNGMMLGILLLSIGCLFHANQTTNDDDIWYHVYILSSAFCYAILITMKHLYLPLGPFYFVYLLRNYCFAAKNNQQQPSLFQIKNFVMLGFVTATTVILPFVPFRHHMSQMLQRLFPFGRGLVHDYWAANVWAIYMFLKKFKLLPADHDIPPKITVLLLLLNLLPILYFVTWKKPTTTPSNKNKELLHVVIFSSWAQFMFAYHVHEKAIMTALIPFILLVGIELYETTKNNSDNDKNDSSSNKKTTICYIWFQCMAIGLLGLFPLLYRSVELPMKLVTYVAYMLVCYHFILAETIPIKKLLEQRHIVELVPLLLMILFVIVILEFVPISVYGRFEFLPLMMTSVLCSMSLIVCYMRFTYTILTG